MRKEKIQTLGWVRQRQDGKEEEGKGKGERGFGKGIGIDMMFGQVFTQHWFLGTKEFWLLACLIAWRGKQTPNRKLDYGFDLVWLIILYVPPLMVPHVMC